MRLRADWSEPSSWAVIISGAFLLWACVAAALPAKVTDLQLQRETVMITAGGPSIADGAIGGGSGSYIGDGLILTARHVVITEPLDPQSDRRDNLWVTTYDGQHVKASIAFVSEDTDFAILRVPALKEPVARLSCSSPQTGEAVKAVGNPLLLINWAVSPGSVVSTKAWDTNVIEVLSGGHFDLDSAGWKTIVGATTPVLPGNSGGPIFDAAGDQIGILVAGFTPFSGFIPTASVCAEIPRL